MKLKDYRTIFSVVGLIGVLLIVTPALACFFPFPNREHFSQLYIWGSKNSTENYPFNIVAGQNYSVYLGVRNHVGSSVYYVLYVKFGNQTDQFPGNTTGTSSPLQPLYEYRFLLQNNKAWESSLNFSVSDVSFSGNRSSIGKLLVNDFVFYIKKPAIWDTVNHGFYYQVFMELWTYNIYSGLVEFNNRAVSLNLNLTLPSISS
jgi:uncharacterized membrane protein